MNKQMIMDAESKKLVKKGDITKETELLLQYGQSIASDKIKVIAHIEPIDSKNASYIDIYRLDVYNDELDFITRKTENYYL